MSDQQQPQEDAPNERQPDPPGLDSTNNTSDNNKHNEKPSQAEEMTHAEEKDDETKTEQHDDKDADNDDDVFINQGLRLWEQSRQQWLGRSDTDSTARPAAVPMEVDDIIEVVFNVSRQSAEDGPPKFPKSVPLPQMVDILVDLWEAEGLDI